MPESVLVASLDHHIGEITLNRPSSLNTFTLTLASELNQALLQLDGDPAVRVLIIKGAGKAFCAGIDVSDFSDKSTMDYREWIECMETPLVTISRMKKPVIAQVHGVAAANGAGLVAAADLAIAAETAGMGLTAINVGLNCVGPVVPVSRSVGRKRAMELLLYGELIKAPQALDMGLVNKVVPAADLEMEARRWAAVLAAKSPLAVQNAKSAFYAAADLEYDKAFNYMNEAFARLCSTADAKEGVSAFLEKRTPTWKEK
ncbi:enoyl-CoA hydratase/isomerase family protein [Desulfosarcina ovata]|uniref:Enoyl-CoA hydratase n=2 Tax=Desulfosarcina ovata TaxID=83564 RepID=A0A5K8AEH9_9BACT|nr:enoyl-CoA hydratase-related protein [Desulfosarcina ovata]BBO84435.1 enoyl-CoA hydratase [Desulfosarcina ovata subsp. sediminis]BBO90949.1 enoyl-CoA hydratase [Desulfosarcina ovata subsp. ovata]